MKMFFQNWRMRRQARRVLKSAQYICNMREDITGPEDSGRLKEAMRKLADAVKSSNRPGIAKYSREIEAITVKIYPVRPYAAWRENIEVIVVALAVAMAFRTYFVQPFKIPTSSMYPTLSGIQFLDKKTRTSFDYFPLNLVKLVVFGERYFEIRARNSGMVNISSTREGGLISVNGLKQKFYYGMPEKNICVTQDETVITGQVLAAGVIKAGDHIFVNRIKWHFMRPERGEIMVFRTDGIEHPGIRQKEHYVKRMVGLPGETIGIKDPDIFINGERARGVEMMDKIQACAPGYNGYIQQGNFMGAGKNAVKLGADEYFACGDNQRNSLDSRYWGPVPAKNLVGSAFFVYWPLSANWGAAR
jgi:signal peptidase I